MEKGAVVLTGAAGGIGVGVAGVLSRAGYRVVATDVCPAPPSLVCHAFIQADLARVAAEADYAADLAERLGQALDGAPLAALVNNAAVQLLGGIEAAQDQPALSAQMWRDTLAVNLLAPYCLIQALLPRLLAARGCVVNIGSIHAHATKRRFAAYAASKAALASLTRSLALELGGRVRVNAVEPAAVDTPMLRDGFAHDPAGLARLADYHPARRIGDPAALGRLVAWIIEADDGFLHGAAIPFDGGLSGMLPDPDNEP